MKRPLAGLLATAAAVPGAWLLASSDEGHLPSPDPIDPDSADAVQPKPDPAAMLATIEPSFGRVVDLPTPAEAVPATVADLTASIESTQRETPSAEPEQVAEPAPPVLAVQTPPAPQPAFTAQPVIQPLPSVPLAAKQDKVVAQQPEPAQAKLAAAEPAPQPIPPMRHDLAFTAKPVIQPLPQPIIVAQAEPTPNPPPAVVSAQIPTKSLVQSELLVQPTQPKTPLRPGPVLAAKNVPIPAAQVDERPVLKSQLAGREVPIRLPVSQAVIQPLTTDKLPVIAPVKLERPVPMAKAPALAAAKPPVANSQPLAMPPAPAVQPAMVAPPAPPRLATVQKPPAVMVASKPRAVTPPAPAPVASRLPVGEVVLAAYSPAPALATVSPVKPRQNLVETTAAKTVPIGAPERVTYPEPAFGPSEAKFIPAALSSVEPPEQPAAIGSASTLAQAIAYSYETNPRLLAERASTRSADLGYPAARAAFGPRLDASASLSYTRDRDEILPGSFLRQQGWSDTASLILSQPLLTFGRSQARVGQAAANVDFRRESLRLVQNEVMLDVIGAYVGTLREAGAVTIARENVALLQRQLEESNARFAVREITLADVQQVETRLALGKTVLLEAQARLGEIQSRFYRAVGMPPGELAPPEPLTLPVSSLPEAYSLADNESPLVRAAQARERISRAFLASTRAESAPRVDFRGSADYGSMSDYSRDLRGTRVRGTVTLSVPLFDSGARSAESGQAREANSADLQLIAAAQRDSRTAVATGWNNVLAARLSIDHYRQAVESAQRAYENAQRQERAGMRTTLDVLDLARDLLNVRNAYNAALAEEYQARATLLATLGQLDPAKMSDGIKLYDPADHFRKVRGKGDIPLLTGTLAALDGVVLPNLRANKPSPDAAALVGTAETVTGE